MLYFKGIKKKKGIRKMGDVWYKPRIL